MRRILVTLVAIVALLGLVTGTQAASMTCAVSSPISAMQLNEPTDATWSFEVFNAAPNTTYLVKVAWPGDPSNGGHYNAEIVTDATGHGVSVRQRYWAPDGFLPGYFAFHDPYDPMSGFVAVPGEFSVQVGPRTSPDGRLGKATCDGTVVP